MGRAKGAFAMWAVLLLAGLCCACVVSEAVIDCGESGLYAVEDLEAAAEIILTEFADFDGWPGACPVRGIHLVVPLPGERRRGLGGGPGVYRLVLAPGSGGGRRRLGAPYRRIRLRGILQLFQLTGLHKSAMMILLN